MTQFQSITFVALLFSGLMASTLTSTVSQAQHAPVEGAMLHAEQQTTLQSPPGLAQHAWTGATAETVEWTDDPQRPLAIVRRFRPDVLIQQVGQSEMVEATRAFELFDQDTLVTDEDNGYAQVQFMDNSMARVQPNSVLIVRGEITEQNTTAAQLALELGEAFLNVEGDQSQYEVSTASAVAAVRGTEFTSAAHEDGSSTFVGFSGEVEVTALTSEDTVTLQANEGAHVDASGDAIEQFEVSEEEIQQMRQEYENRDQGTRGDILRLNFENEDGEIREIELRYYDNTDNP